MCGATSKRVAAFCSSCSLQKYLERWRAVLNETGRSVGVNVNEGTQDPETWTKYSSLAKKLFAVYAQQTAVHLSCGLLRVCAACPTPRLNLSFELRPSWNNIHDTFPTGTAQDTTWDLTDEHRDMSLRSEAICRHLSSRITLSPQISKAKTCIHLPRFVCQNKQLNLNRHVQGSNPNSRLQIHDHYSVRFLSYLCKACSYLLLVQHWISHLIVVNLFFLSPLHMAVFTRVRVTVFGNFIFMTHSLRRK